ncbi:hypothetical protein METP2_00183 [Methanosarcinales archaeon]|nr:hypothetical protein METP2_00183 [Methanosarcinales archaeon]
MKNGYLIRVSLTTMLMLLFFGISATNVLADGTETLGDPSISLSPGSGVVVAGTGMETQPGTININVPGTVKQVLLYWSGGGDNKTIGDNIVTVNGTPVTGTLIGGPAFFYTYNINYYFSSYRKDITGLNLVSQGLNSLKIEDMDFGGDENNGAGILVIYDNGVDNAEISLKDGIDLAFIDFPEPRKSTVLQTLNFTPDTVSRTANLAMFFGSISSNGRPNSIEVVTGGIKTVYSDLLASVDGPQWDSLNLPVNIPPGETNLTVQAFSRDDTSGTDLPASLTWTAASLSILMTNPAITIKKYTNGSDADTAPGPYLTTGNPVIWTYIVTNIGNVDLTNVIVTDDKGVTVTCPKTALAVGESMTCTASGTAAAGQYENIGTANGTNASKTVTATDPSHYYGKVKTLVTRTPGYWQTHYVEADREWTKVVAAGNALQCGAPENFIVNNTPGLEGGFWSSISYETNKHKRTSVDQARMQLAFQLLAAILNNQAFGSDPGGTVLNDARTNFCGTNRNAMLASKSLLDTFNNGGSNKLFPTGYINGKADPKTSQSVAAKVYWNQPTLPGIP